MNTDSKRCRAIGWLTAGLFSAATLMACGGDADGGDDTNASGGTAGAGASSSGGSSSGGSAGTSSGGTSSGGTTGLPKPENHRPTATMCDDERPAEPFENQSGEGCESHDDCTEGRNGRCSPMRFGFECTYDDCLSDSDCPPDHLCECEAATTWTDRNACLPGNCRVDSDCGDGGFCSPTFGSCGSYSDVIGYYCRTPDDECLNDSECVDEQGFPGYCMYEPQVAHWICGFGQCVG